MADISLFGRIESIRDVKNGVLLKLSERRSGYKSKDGTFVKEELLVFHILFKPFFRKYISEYFDVGSLVKIKGTLLPYYRSSDGELRDGITIFGQTLDMCSYPSRHSMSDKRALDVDSSEGLCSPDPEGYFSDEF